jgi:uncharacterized protein (DUF1697 family)
VTAAHGSKRASRALRRHVLLLRGINVGGKNKLSMEDLRAMLLALGATHVSTYIQSGNAVFSASDGVAERVERELSARIALAAGLDVPVVLRSGSQFLDASTTHPLAPANGEDDALHVAFLARAPSRAETDALDPQRSPGDSFVVRGRELYLRLENGAARTKLTNAYFDRVLGTVSTMRNWRTVLALRSILASDQRAS